MRAARIEGVLFDLDGTLLDTAGDLATALNRVLAEQGRSPLPEARIRPTVSHGAVVMLCHAFALAPDDPAMPALHEAMLRHYEADIAGRTRPFPGMETVLARVEALGLPWGIVTNKPARLTHPLLAALGLDRRAAAVVCGDTAPRPKPHPDPMEAACATLDVAGTATSVARAAEGVIGALVTNRPDAAAEATLRRLRDIFGDRAYAAISYWRRPGDMVRIDRLAAMARAARVAPLATGDVLFHSPDRRMLQDVVTAIRETGERFRAR